MVKSTKVCTSCKEEKLLESFGKKCTGRLGRESRCRLCISLRDKKALSQSNARRRKRYSEKPEYREKVLARNALWQKENSEWRNSYSSSWRGKNLEKVKGYWDKHYAENRHNYIFRAGLRQEKILQATPKWANIEDISRVYELCRKISDKTGVPHEVDHAIPLKGENVCGLHVFQNLQIVTKERNRQKSNTWKRDWE